MLSLAKLPVAAILLVILHITRSEVRKNDRPPSYVGNFVPFPFAELITNATAYILDNVSRARANSIRIHLRNVPVDATDKTVCNGGNGCGAQMTTVSNQALVFEAPLVGDTTASDIIVKGAHALVCGLDVFNASFLPKSPQARWVFASLLEYAIDMVEEQ